MPGLLAHLLEPIRFNIGKPTRYFVEDFIVALVMRRKTDLNAIALEERERNLKQAEGVCAQGFDPFDFVPMDTRLLFSGGEPPD